MIMSERRGALIRYPHCNCAMWGLWLRWRDGGDEWFLYSEYVEYEAAKYEADRFSGRAETDIRQIR